MSKKTVTCFCEHTFEVDFPDTFDVQHSPEILTHILNGTFMTFLCPKCGKTLKPEFPCSLIDSSREIEIGFIPEEQRSGYLKGTHPFPALKRVVIGYKELVEKIKIVTSDLDDRIIEIIKFYLYQKAEQEDKNIEIFFHEKESSNRNMLVFHIYGLQTDQLGVLNIPFSLYEKNADDFPNQEPFDEILKPPYISIKKITIGES